MLKTEAVDAHSHAGAPASVPVLVSISLAVATLITIAWIALGVLLVGS